MICILIWDVLLHRHFQQLVNVLLHRRIDILSSSKIIFNGRNIRYQIDHHWLDKNKMRRQVKTPAHRENYTASAIQSDENTEALILFYNSVNSWVQDGFKNQTSKH